MFGKLYINAVYMNVSYCGKGINKKSSFSTKKWSGNNQLHSGNKMVSSWKDRHSRCFRLPQCRTGRENPGSSVLSSCRPSSRPAQDWRPATFPNPFRRWFRAYGRPLLGNFSSQIASSRLKNKGDYILATRFRPSRENNSKNSSPKIILINLFKLSRIKHQVK